MRTEATSGRELYLSYSPQLASDITPDRTRAVYDAIAAQVQATGKAPGPLTLLMRGEWKRAIAEAKIADGVKIRLRATRCGGGGGGCKLN